MTAPLPPSGARRIPKPVTSSTSPDSGPVTIRLNKRMAELGMCSRREADDWIDRGWVRVNGKPALMGQPVSPS
ncbi:MAG: S4 domain-containing protein, partial [Polaromonas sp.]